MSSNRTNRRNIYGIPGNFSFMSQITDRTSAQFLEDILKIHENQYTPINNIPTILGRKIDLLALYNAVAKRGGFKKMNTESSWEGVLTDLKMPIKCANASVALRSIFQRYLEPFERLQRNKATITDIEDELQMESDNRYKTAVQRTTLTHCNFNPTSMVYRADMHQIGSHKRQESGLSCDLSDVVEFHKLEMSLKSGLVNEIEFSLNTVLLMSFQTDGVHLCRNHRLLDLILSTIGVGDFELLKDLSEHDRSTRKFLQFWNDMIVYEEGRKFLLPDIFVIDDYEIPKLERLNHMFKLYDELTVYDKEGQRIQLVATIIRNLALDTLNSRLITQSHQCMRLIILCCYASHFALRQIGLEILSMLSFPVIGVLCETLKDFLIDLINSEDRVDRLRGLELLSHLSDQRVSIDNIEFLSGLPKPFFASLISMLILHDLHIVVLALEAVYGLSEVDSCLCTKLVDCSAETLSTLFILLSLEAQVMGTQSLIRIRVMQGPAVSTNSSSTSQTALHRASLHQPQSNQKQLATSLMPPPPVPTHKIPTTTVSVANLSKPQPPATTEPTGALNKPQITQKIYPIITRNNAIFPSFQSNGLSQTSMPPIVKSELITTSLIPLLTSEIVSQSLVNTRPCMNDQTSLNKLQSIITPNNQTTQLNSNTNHTVVTISPISPSVSISRNTSINPPCISTLVNNQGSRESSALMKQLVMTPSSGQFISEECPSDTVSENNTPLPAVHRATTQTFTNKQDFVKSWLLSNYMEVSQCTVPLFVMYKQLQVAVQNYFKDSEMVTAEEFHKLVRILFPEVQLVQLNTAAGAVEIHYYNLKVSPKPSALDILLESHASKCKQIITSSVDTNLSLNNVPHINSAQINCVVSTIKTEETNNDQKQWKRHATSMVNGHSTELDQSGVCANKRPRTDNEFQETFPNTNNNHNINTPTTQNLKETQYANGIVTPIQPKNQLSQVDERHYQSHTNVHINQILNGSVSEELKHSDSETRAFSSSTVSPLRCESLANGTDGSSEGTMDSELGRVIANIPITNVLSNGLSNTTTVTGSNTTQSTTISTLDTNFTKRSAKKNNFNQLGRTRSRFRNNNPGSKGKQRGSSSQRPHNLSYLYICEWDNCLQSFDKPQKVYGHVYTNHFMTLRTEVESMCFWAGCKDATQRTPLPLLNHVNEQHCNNVALESARQIRLAKEKEKSIPYTSENNIAKSETESIPKLLNFCSPQQTSASSTSSHTSMIPVTLLSSCTPIQPAISMAPASILSPISLSSAEPVSTCSTSMIQSSSLTSIMTTSTPIVQANSTSLPVSNPSDEMVIPENNVCRSPQQDMSQINMISNTSQTVIPSISTSQSGAAINQHLPSVKIGIKEGPVTKHIRFLSALILRNLCQCSHDARRFVASRHQQIFEMSISGCESSRVLSECLYYSSIDNSGSSRKQK